MKEKIESTLVRLSRLDFGGSDLEDEDESKRRAVLLECVAMRINRRSTSNPSISGLSKKSRMSYTQFPSEQARSGIGKMMQMFKRCANSRRTLEMPLSDTRSALALKSPLGLLSNHRLGGSTKSNI